MRERTFSVVLCIFLPGIQKGMLVSLTSNVQAFDEKYSTKTHYFSGMHVTGCAIARFRDRSLIATFCPPRPKPVDTVDWQVAKKIGSLSLPPWQRRLCFW